MSEGGHSERRKDFFGDDHQKHFDEKGNPTGSSTKDTGLLGGEYTRHRDQTGKTVGTSEDNTGFLGDKHTQHFDNKGDKAGWSEERADFLGNTYIQHFDQNGNKTGRTEKRTDFFGEEYEHHEGEVPHKTGKGKILGRAVDAGTDTGLVGSLIALGLVFAALMLVILVIVASAVVALVVIPVSLVSAGCYWLIRRNLGLSDSLFTEAGVAVEREKKGRHKYRVDEAFIAKHVSPWFHVTLLCLPAAVLTLLLALADPQTSDDQFAQVLLVIGSVVALLGSWFCVRWLLRFLARRKVLQVQGLNGTPEIQA